MYFVGKLRGILSPIAFSKNIKRIGLLLRKHFVELLKEVIKIFSRVFNKVWVSRNMLWITLLEFHIVWRNYLNKDLKTYNMICSLYFKQNLPCEWESSPNRIININDTVILCPAVRVFFHKRHSCGIHIC